MAADWNAWHGHYDDPSSDLARRLLTVRTVLGDVLARRGAADTTLVSMCAGDGRDTLPVLADGHRGVRAVLVDIDPTLGVAARAAASAADLQNVEVRTADAALLATYADIPRADVLLACGVFGNVTDEALERIVVHLPLFLNDDAVVLWTRGARQHGHDPSTHDGDPSDHVRDVFTGHGYREEAFIRPAAASYRVGLHRRTAAVSTPAVRDAVLFTFTR